MAGRDDFMNKIIFLGTGSAAHLARQMTAILFVIDGRGILVDCGDGMGTVRNIVAAGVPFSIVNDVLITHRHADHIAGMPHFLFVKMIEDKEAKVRVFGSRQALVAAKTISFLTHDYTRDNRHRIAFVPLPTKKPVKLYPKIQVVAAKMQHLNLAAYAYRITVGEKQVVFTGDAVPSRALSNIAAGADILIHECFGLDKNRDDIHGGHSTARDAGELAANSEVKHLILTHFPKENMVKPDALLKEAGRFFRGKITLAEDLMEIEI